MKEKFEEQNFSEAEKEELASMLGLKKKVDPLKLRKHLLSITYLYMISDDSFDSLKPNPGPQEYNLGQLIFDLL